MSVALCGALWLPANLLAQDRGSLSVQIDTLQKQQALGLIAFLDEGNELLSNDSEGGVTSRRSVARPTSSNSWIQIEAIARSANALELRADLQQLGLRNSQRHGRQVSGWLPRSRVNELATLTSLQFATAGKMQLRAGNITSEGDKAMLSDVARQKYGVTGKGVTVGIISDSFDCLGGASDDRINGELPEQIQLVEEAADCVGRTDEGRALMQVIHDIAPDAKLAFHSGGNGVASFANGIVELATDALADVIVDDSSPAYDLFFQDDVVVQAIDRVNSMGVTYITAAGNNGRLSYESRFNEFLSESLDIRAHDFDEGSGVDVLQKITVEEGTSIELVLQWDEPAFSVSGPPGTLKDLDIFITDSIGATILAGSAINNVGKDPVELLSFENPTDSQQTEFNILIINAGIDPPGLIKYAIQGRFSGNIDEYATNSGSIAGHSNALKAISVGAADYRNTSGFGIDPPVLQFFSTAGGTPILFTDSGELLPTPEIRKKPDIVGPDDVNTTFFEGEDSDNDGYPNFLGTSAAAPHIAGAVALMLESNPRLQPQDIKTILHNTATDMGGREETVTPDNTGFDFDTGYGFINIDEAVSKAQSSEASAPTNSTTPSNDPIVYSEAFGGTGSITINSVVVLCLVYLRRRTAYLSKML